MPTAGLYAFPSDLVDEGPAQVARAAADLGADALVLALAYHQARDLVPHAGDKPVVRYRDDAVFVAASRWWEGLRLRPQEGPDLERAAVAELLALADRPAVEAWTVFCHNTSLGRAVTDVASRTCFGDRLYSNLCPANPDVVAYACALASAVVAQGVDVVAEALSAQTFAHGHHHERSFTPLGDLDEAILGLCFCDACSARAQGRGADVPRLAHAAQAHLRLAFAGRIGGPASPEALADALGPDVLTLMDCRRDAVTGLAAAVTAVVRSGGRRLSYMDLTGAVLGYADGLPTGAEAGSQAWRLSIDPAAVGSVVDSYTVLGYASDPERLAADVASVRAAVGPLPLTVILRPGWPDTTSPAHLADKVAAAREGGADRVDFYNYGMYDAAVLARIPGALRI